MKLIKILLFTLLLTPMFAFAANVPPIITTDNKAASLAPMLKNVMPGVVNISVRGELPPTQISHQSSRPAQNHTADYIPKFEEAASGVIIDAQNGFILTNAHVVKDAKVIVVTLDDARKLQAKVIGYDIPSDLAVIKINAKHLNALSFGDSDKLKVGDFVAAIGNPFGLQQTVTYGVISGLERNNLGIEGLENFIQTDAPINPGNSGGALINMNGELIGINTALITTSPAAGNIGVGLSIPSNMAKSVMQQLIKFGDVQRGMLGVLVQDITPSLAEAMNLKSTEGALISRVVPNSPAALIGLKPKDVIIAINSTQIHTASQVSNTVSLLRVGTKINLTVLSEGKTLQFSAINSRPEVIKEKREKMKTLLSGIELSDFDELIDGEYIKGVQVLSLDDASTAYSYGLRSNDVIVAVANKPVTSINELYGIAAKNPTQLLLEIRRGFGGNLFLVLEQ
jgi:serine protease Do